MNPTPNPSKQTEVVASLMTISGAAIPISAAVKVGPTPEECAARANAENIKEAINAFVKQFCDEAQSPVDTSLMERAMRGEAVDLMPDGCEQVSRQLGWEGNEAVVQVTSFTDGGDCEGDEAQVTLYETVKGCGWLVVGYTLPPYCDDECDGNIYSLFYFPQDQAKALGLHIAKEAMHSVKNLASRIGSIAKSVDGLEMVDESLSTQIHEAVAEAMVRK